MKDNIHTAVIMAGNFCLLMNGFAAKTSLKLVYTLRQLLLSHPMALTLTSVMTMAIFGLISHVPTSN